MNFLVFLSNADEFNFDTSNNVCLWRRSNNEARRECLATFRAGLYFQHTTDSVSDNLPSGLQISDIRLRTLSIG